MFALLFNEEKYLAMALSHGMAMNLEAPDLAELHRAGTFPKAGWEQEATQYARQGMEEIRSALASSFATLAGITVASVLALSIAGSISPYLPVSWAKVLSASGAFFAAWATLFALGGIWRSWDGVALHELVHPKLFKLLFFPGTLLAMLGQLW